MRGRRGARIPTGFGAHPNACLTQCKGELQPAVAEQVVEREVRKRSQRLGALQKLIDESLALIEMRKVLYADVKEGAHIFEVQNASEDATAIAEGCRVRPVVARLTIAPDGKS